MVRGALPSLPLKHHYKTRFSLRGENTSYDTTILPILVCDKSKTNAYDTITDPNHAGYAGILEHPMTFLGSEVDKVRVGMSFAMPANVETNVNAVNVQIMPICMSFDDYNKEDTVASQQLIDLIAMKMHSGGNYMEPKWNTWKVGSLDLFTNATTYFSMSTNDQIEAVSFVQDDYQDAVRDSTLKGVLRKVTPGGLRNFTVYRDRPFALKDEFGKGMWFKVPPKCRRQNQYTFFGLLVNIPQFSDGINQFHSGGDTAVTNHIDIGADIYYNEKNADFARN